MEGSGLKLYLCSSKALTDHFVDRSGQFSFVHLQFGQINFSIWTDTFSNIHKSNDKNEQIYMAIWNIYIKQFEMGGGNGLSYILAAVKLLLAILSAGVDDSVWKLPFFSTHPSYSIVFDHIPSCSISGCVSRPTWLESQLIRIFSPPSHLNQPSVGSLYRPVHILP